jgi:hypothetical protein
MKRFPKYMTKYHMMVAAAPPEEYLIAQLLLDCLLDVTTCSFIFSAPSDPGVCGVRKIETDLIVSVMSL